jgi:hypothetical protein
MPKEQINYPTDDKGAVVVNWGRQSATYGDGGVIVAVTQDESVQSVNLTRTEVNKLIRTLRRARDAAMGEDA